MKKIIFGLFALSMLSLAGCKKDKKNGNCELSSASLQGSYNVTAVSHKPNATSPVEDAYAAWDQCEKDDVFTFAANFQASVTDAGMQCTPTSAETGTWAFNSGNNELSFTMGTTYIYNGTVGNYSCTGMTVTKNGPAPGEVSIITFAKQ